MHQPHQVWPEWADRYRGVFSDGWDVVRRQNLERQKELGVVPGTRSCRPRTLACPLGPTFLRPIGGSASAKSKSTLVSCRTPTTRWATSSENYAVMGPSRTLFSWCSLTMGQPERAGRSALAPPCPPRTAWPTTPGPRSPPSTSGAALLLRPAMRPVGRWQVTRQTVGTNSSHTKVGLGRR